MKLQSQFLLYGMSRPQMQTDKVTVLRAAPATHSMTRSAKRGNSGPRVRSGSSLGNRRVAANTVRVPLGAGHPSAVTWKGTFGQDLGWPIELALR